MISTPDRQNAITLIDQAKVAGARRAPACAELGIDERTIRRWRAMDDVPRDRRLSTGCGYWFSGSVAKIADG